MTIEKKLLGTSPSGDAANVADVFSTFLYKGTGSNRTINNGIDLAGEGGLIWIKAREDTVSHALFDTVRGVHNMLVTDTNAGQDDKNTSVTAFNSNGFNLGSGYEVNEAAPNEKYVSWTFRKKEKFFTCLSYTGNGTSSPQISQSVSHDLGAVPAMMIVKQSNGQNNWVVYHKNIGNTHELVLNETGGKASSQPSWNNTTPTDTVFTVGPDSNTTNKSGQTYIAYLFADNSSEDADDQMIKCGTVSGQQTINLGWEPQFLLMKKTSGSGDWRIIDSMRGFTVKDKNDAWLKPNTNATESTGDFVGINSTGFFSDLNGDYIFCAIRAEMMKEPEAATDVFAVDNGNGSDVPAFNSGFPVDMTFWTNTGGDNRKIASRLTVGSYLETDGTGAEQADSSYAFDYQSGWYSAALASTNYAWMWKRAKGYMDVVCDKRAFTYGTLNHSLGVVPELIIKKDRSRTNYWDVMPNVSPYDYRYNLYLNDTQAISGPSSAYWNSAPTDTVFGVHYGNDGSSNGDNFVFYLFASLAGISKVGYYTGNGSSQTISCGFSAGARFVLIKRTNAAGDWYVWDSVRGISAGNDPHLSLNTTAAQVTNDDSVDPHNSGFIVNQVAATNINVSSATYVFYAIA